MYQGKQQFDELQADTLRKTTNPVEKHKVCRHASKKCSQTDPSEKSLNQSRESHQKLENL